MAMFVIAGSLLLAQAATEPPVAPPTPPAPVVPADPLVELHCVFRGATVAQIDRAIAAENLDLIVPSAERQAVYEECESRYRWSEDRSGLIQMYVNALLQERGARRGSGFTPAQLARIDAAYEATDQARLREMAGPLLDHFLENEGRSRYMTREESRFFGEIATRSGISNAGAAGSRVDPIIMMRLLRETIQARLMEQGG